MVKQEAVSKSGVTYRIVNDAPIWMRGCGIYAIERYRADWDAWVQVFPESGKSERDYLVVYKEFKKLLEQ